MARRTHKKYPTFGGVLCFALVLAAAQSAAQDSPWQAYGQLNIGVLSFDDGEVNTNFGLVDNDNSSSRLGVFYNGQVGQSPWEMFGNFEVQYNPKSTVNVSQIEPEGGSADFESSNLRKLEVRFSNPDFGRVWVGQGSMASDGISGHDLSGTGVIAGGAEADSAGGVLFRQTDGALSDVTVGDTINRYDGFGRKVRLRYDTPEISGFAGMISYGQDLLAENSDSQDERLVDVAASYSGATDAYQVSAGVGYGYNLDTDRSVFSGSISGLHLFSGLSLTVAAGQNSEDGLESTFGYAKLGWERDLFRYGSTAVSLDYYGGDNISELGDASGSVGAAVVQNIGYQQLWFTVRSYDYDRAATSFYDGLAVFGGTRLRF